MSKGVTREEKRKVKEEEKIFFGLLKTIKHFFPCFLLMISQVKEPRREEYITYTPDEMLFTGTLKKIMGIESMRQMDDKFNTQACIENGYRSLSKKAKKNLPHHDTLNDYLEKLEPVELEKIRDSMIKSLLKSRALEQFRLPGKRWGILLDGTGLYTFKKKHCDHCLRRELVNRETGEKRTIYMHHVLEAKLVCGDMVLSIDSEFIENEHEDVEKQDCEIKAFHRLAERIKKKYPKLPVCIIGDSLYACDPVFNTCKANHWTYLIRFKEGSIPTVGAEAEAIREMGGLERDGSGSCLYSNEVVAQHRTVNYLEQRQIVKKDGKEEEKRYVFLTDIAITKGNAADLAKAGRSRWKIENEGFNIQKNHRCYIEHVWSKNYTAMKNHYLLAQIAEIIRQLYEQGAKWIRTAKSGIKEISSLLLESIRTRPLTDEDIQNLDTPIQIRFV